MNASSTNNFNFFDNNTILSIKINEDLKVFDIFHGGDSKLFSPIELVNIFSNSATQEEVEELLISIERVFSSKTPEARIMKIYNHHANSECYWNVTNFPIIKQ